MRQTRLILIFVLLAFGCETPLIYFEGPYFVRFTDTSLTELESHSAPLKIEVHLAAPARDEELTIFYSVAGSAREGVDYRINGTRGQVQVDKGAYTGYIEVQLINNANNILRSQDIQFTLKSTTSSEINVGQSEGGLGTKFSLTIEDDCILGGDYLAGRSTPSSPVTVKSQDCETYTLSNWNINVFQISSPMDLTFVDNGDNTITIPQQKEIELEESIATIKGSGVVDPITSAIILNITLVDITNQPVITINLKRN